MSYHFSSPLTATHDSKSDLPLTLTYIYFSYKHAYVFFNIFKIFHFLGLRGLIERPIEHLSCLKSRKVKNLHSKILLPSRYHPESSPSSNEEDFDAELIVKLVLVHSLKDNKRFRLKLKVEKSSFCWVDAVGTSHLSLHIHVHKIWVIRNGRKY